MTHPDFLSTPDLTPEERVRENERLSDIDEAMQRKAFETLTTKAAPTEALIEQKNRLIFELQGDTAAASEQLMTELDPNFEDALIITVNKKVEQPSKLPFIKRIVSVYKNQELAAWHFPATPKAFNVPYLGRDGIIYGVVDKKFTIKEIALGDLSIDDLTELQSGIALYLRILKNDQENN